MIKNNNIIKGTAITFQHKNELLFYKNEPFNLSLS